MEKTKVSLGQKIMVVVCYLVMIAVNTIANVLPLNGVTTAEVSNSYPNLFAPAPITFSIWGLIYTLLLLYIVYLFVAHNYDAERLGKINIYFIISCAFNTLWMVVWSYKMIPLSVVMMLGILICLIRIAMIADKIKSSMFHRLAVQVPFGIYMGWITVATIANVTVLLVSLGFDGYGVSDEMWMIVILIVGVLIAGTTALRFKNVFYALPVIWAYGGIWLQHTQPDGFNNAYPNIILTDLICIGVLVICAVAAAWMWIKKGKAQSKEME